MNSVNIFRVTIVERKTLYYLLVRENKFFLKRNINLHDN